MDTYSEGDRAGHARNQDDAAAVPETNHLLSCRLGDIEGAIDVDIESLYLS